MNKEIASKGLNKVFIGFILEMLGNVFDSGASTTVTSFSDVSIGMWISAILSIAGLAMVLIGLKGAAEASEAYMKARRYAIASIVFQIMGPISDAIINGSDGASAAGGAGTSVLVLIADMLAIKWILKGNQAVNSELGNEELSKRAAKLWKRYLCFGLIFSIVFLVIAVLGIGFVNAQQAGATDDQLFKVGSIVTVGFIIVLITGIVTLVTFFQILSNTKKTEKALLA